MDHAERLVHAIREAQAASRRLVITGSGSKQHWLPAGSGEALAVSEHSGVVDYEPSELVVTVRAGTRLKELRQMLAREGQKLAAEPPEFRGSGTVGGAVASGLSGPARPWGGSLRDAVLGVVLLTGSGEILRFGGQVVKNVAGYDVSRLVTGSWGALGVILEVSLRVAPAPEQELTLAYAYDAEQALEQMRGVARLPLPLTGTFWCRDELLLRFAGSEAALNNVRQRLGGQVHSLVEVWQDVRDQSHEFFKADSLHADREGKSLVRAVLPAASSIQSLVGDLAMEWGGGLRWLWSEAPATVSDSVDRAGGWSWTQGSDQPLDSAQRGLMRRIKAAFDPQAVFGSRLLDEAQA